MGKRSGNTFDLWEFFGANPFKGRFPPPLFCHVDFLDELQAPQHVGYIIQPAHFGCKHMKQTTRLSTDNTQTQDVFGQKDAWEVWSAVIVHIYM